MCPLARWGGFSARKIASHDLDIELSAPGVGVHHCLTCGACELRCPQGVRYTEYVRGLREMLPVESRLPVPHGEVLYSAARSMAGPNAPAKTFEWLDDDLRVAEKGDVALFVGCAPLFDATFRADLGIDPLETARAAVRLMNAAGIEPVLLAEERCCGHDLTWAGDRDTFEVLARANVQAFADRGVRRIVTACAECARTWRMDYPWAAPGHHFEVQHVAEFVAEALDEGSLAPGDGRETTVTYQDPCRLGRHMGVYDAPRKVIEALPNTDLVEMDRAGKDALCCGTSGFLNCDAASRKLQAERLGNARDTGAEALVTACPKCAIHLTCAQATARGKGEELPPVRLMDFTVLAASRLRAGGARAGIDPPVDGRETGGTR
jgi:Fe-S oxidoreductase